MSEIYLEKKYWITRRFCNTITVEFFNTAIEMEDRIETICVSYGEDGLKDNIIAESHTYEERQMQREVKE